MPGSARRTSARPARAALQLLLAGALLAAPGLASAARGKGAPPARAPHDGAKVLLTGLLFDGVLKGDPEPEEAVRIQHVGRGDELDLSGWAISDTFGPPRVTVADKDSDKNLPRLVRLPAGATIGPGEELWIAHRGDAFLQIFGYPPDFESVDTLPGVPECSAPDGWPTFNAQRGVATLHDASGTPVDLVAYDNKGTGLNVVLPPSLWKGPPVLLDRMDPYGWTGRVLARDQGSDGWAQADTDQATDWDSSASRHKLGVDEVHRVELPGQTHHVASPKVRDARVIAASSPENSFAVMVQALREAKKSIWLHVYEFKHELLCDELISAKTRGIEVRVYLEGSPVGGIPDGERHVVQRLTDAKIPVLFLGAPKGSKRLRVRYRFDHAKYVIIDGTTAIIGSENYGYSGMPIDPSYGNRGWVIRIDEPDFAAQLAQVFNDDTSRPFPDLEGTTLASKAYPDLVGPEDAHDDTYGPPYKDPNFKPDRALRTGGYKRRRAPKAVRGKVSLELVTCPDTCLDEKNAVIGLIHSATKELIITQNSIPPHWGSKKKDTFETAPNLPLAAVIAAARRGVRTRVLIDSTWYNVEAKDPNDNDDTCRFLAKLSAEEELDLACKVIDLQAAHLEKIHTKGVIADGARVLISSINWTENSFKGNREVGVVVGHPEIAGYYRDLFLGDWTDTRLYRVAAGKRGAAAVDLGGKTVAKFRPGQLLDVVGEIGDELEVRIADAKIALVKASDVTGTLFAVPSETLRLMGRTVEVEGMVRSTHVTKGGAFLNFGDDWKRDFSVFVEDPVLAELGWKGDALDDEVKGRTVRVRGTLFEKNGPALNVKESGSLERLR